MLLFTVFLVFVVVPMTAQVLTLPQTSTGAPGETVSVEISYASAAPKAASLQWETIVPAQLMELDSRGLEVGPAARDAGKKLDCSHPKPYISLCVLSGGNGPIPNGAIAQLSFKLKAAPEKLQSWIRLGKVEGTTEDGEKLTLSDASGALMVTDQPVLSSYRLSASRSAPSEPTRTEDKGKEIREAVIDAFKEIIRAAQSSDTASKSQPPKQQASARPAQPPSLPASAAPPVSPSPAQQTRVQPPVQQAPIQQASVQQPSPKASPASPAAPANTEVLEETGRVALRDHKYKEAFDALNQAIRLNPASAKAYNARGFTYYMVRSYDAALRDLDRAVSLDPKYQNAYHNRSIVRRAVGDAKGAAEDESKATSLANAQPAQAAAKK